MRVDLHIHTTASDGCWAPDELIAEILRAGIGLFAVTDHDTIGSVKTCEKMAKERDIGFVRGVELTTKLGNYVCHILGYGIDPDNAALLDVCRENTQHMLDMNISQAEFLIKNKGMKFDLGDFKAYKWDKKRGGGWLTNYLVDKGYYSNFLESLAFVAKNISWDSPPYKEPSHMISTIKAAGGHPVLAHPGSQLLNEGLSDKMLNDLIDMGIEGLECYSNYHKPEAIQKFIDFCKKRGLLITAGSDCHGALLVARKLGHPVAHLEDLNLRGIWPVL